MRTADNFGLVYIQCDGLLPGKSCRRCLCVWHAHGPEAKIDLGNGKTFLITTINYSDKNIYIQSVKLNGQPWSKTYIRHSDIVKGGTLEYTMGPRAE